MKNYQSFMAFVFCVMTSLLTGCASIVTGIHQSVSVETPPVTDATCSLKNSKGIWYVNKTPGSVVIHRAPGKLDVKCNKLGYQQGEVSVNAKLNAMSAGNIAFGGVVGAGIDGVDGAAFHYPQKIQVPMKK